MPASTPLDRDELKSLTDLLRQRLATIGDSRLRDADPEAHLRALQEVSEAISARHLALKGRISPRLDHFLANASFQKALEWLENELSS
jgi:hypothetical protein